VEEGVEAPRRRRRRHVDEGVALVVPRPGHKTNEHINQTRRRAADTTQVGCSKKIRSDENQEP
jgi:hypothetical protein